MNDNNLNQLIAQIKSEAIDAAEIEAKNIVEKAKQEANAIIDQANKQKNEIIAAAQKEATQIVENGKAVLKQASRDMVLSVQNQILDICKKVFEAQ
ncbi:MAG: hypothetical protein SNJ71_04975, partial [Bacteroidales bacterium]